MQTVRHRFLPDLEPAPITSLRPITHNKEIQNVHCNYTEY